MTWHENDGKLMFRNEIKIKSPESRRQTANKSISNPDEVEFDPSSAPWFVIRMKLPEYLCLWGVPMPCHFEADVTGYIEEEVPEEPVIIPKHKKGHAAAVAPSPPASTPATLRTDQFEPEIDKVTSTLRNSIQSINMQADRRSSILRLASNMVAEYGIASHADLVSMGIEDFDLNFPMTKSEMRNLVRHCLPRIISSYKFPSEFTAEAKERSAKAKSAGGTLIRRHSLGQSNDRSTQGTIDKPERTFSTTQQLNPERLFPVFPPSDELRIRMITSDQAEAEPKTFYDLVKILDGIKRYYLGRPLRTANLPSFKPNLKVLLKPSTKPSKASQRLSGERSRRSSRSTMSAHTSSIGIGANRDSRKTAEVKVPSTHQLEVEDEETAVQGESESKTELSLQSSAVSDGNRKTFKFSRWTTRNIKHSEFDREKRMLTIWTDRLGVIGLAYKRYEQLPFRFWSLEPSEENPENEVVFTLETQYAKVVLFITGDGVRGYVTDLQKKFVRNRPMYLVIDEPLKDFRELRKRFREKNLNIFTERDASFYIENGYFSQKHLATELHTYCCMCTHAQLMRFLYSEWNRLSARRSLVFRLVHHKESDEYMCTVRVTPEESTFVTIKELCSDDLDVFNLEYNLTWRNIDFYADLDHLITSMFPSAPEQRVKNPHLIYFLKAILWEIRPLSFS